MLSFFLSNDTFFSKFLFYKNKRELLAKNSKYIIIIKINFALIF